MNCHVCIFADKNRGLLNKDVDVHRNRIFATIALKKAKSQADTGQ